MVGRLADEVVLSEEERAFLEAQVRRHKAARSLSDRCRMILLCAGGPHGKEVGARLGVHEHTVGKWRRRFVKDRIEGLTDECRPGRPRTVSDDQVAAAIERTLNSTPKDATHWSIRSMAVETVHRSTAELEAGISAFIEAHNKNPKPYRWVKSADDILVSVTRFCQRTQQNPCAEL